MSESQSIKEEHEGYQIINIPNGIIKLNLIMNLKS